MLTVQRQALDLGGGGGGPAFSCCISADNGTVGGTSRSRCTWSGMVSSSITCPPHSMTTCPMSCLSRASTRPPITRRRYFGHQITWYFVEYTLLRVDWYRTLAACKALRHFLACGPSTALDPRLKTDKTWACGPLPVSHLPWKFGAAYGPGARCQRVKS